MTHDLVVQRPEGLYCPAGDFHIDPWRAVPRAVITHAHADHARRGHGHYLTSAAGAGLLRLRLGDIHLQPLPYGQALDVGGVRLSLHPAGHVLGSAQVRLEHRGCVWVVSGDYFVSGDHRDANPTCDAFEPQRCHCFVTESTFALPLYRWPAQAEVLAQIDDWWRANAQQRRCSVLLAYSLGKAQRLLAGVDERIGPIVVHDTVDAVNAVYCAQGVRLPATQRLSEIADGRWLQGALVIVPPGSKDGTWAQSLGDARCDAFASGWMQLRSARQRRGIGRGFVLSDHADWPGLQQAISASGASRVIVTHGFEDVMEHWLQKQGLQAGRFRTGFGGDDASG